MAVLFQSESLYQLLVMVYKTEAILNLIVPMLQHETYPVLLSVINLLYSVSAHSVYYGSHNAML